MNSSNELGISVIVCCYNSAIRLPETLKRLALQQVSEIVSWELIVIDNASIDNTFEVAKYEWQKYNTNIPFRVVKQPKPGLTFAREMGVECSKFSFILFCDDDNWLTPNYLELGFSILKEFDEVGIVGGKGEVVSDVNIPAWYNRYSSFYATAPQFNKSGYIDSNKPALYGAGLFIKKEVFTRLNQKGFKSILTDRKGALLSSGGDYELCYAATLIGYKLYYDEKLLFYHYMPAERLTINYLQKLTSAIAYSSIQLLIYLHLINGRKLNKYSWIKDTLYILKITLKSLFNLLVRENYNQLENRIDFKYNYSSLKSIWNMRKMYQTYYLQIARLISSNK
ncbi:glycosyltransferase family 2 protein [Adhaeribacter swui]|uniref:Glycosyltransferase family 2 protein n=1 Tax=Adhaeribacter swui TaxID=2086471 RepID=A0A7G7G9I0_9BACT|nr:glycosyltransferase [Adhaeribacter swui]QNF33814.1 glycosyltransferase family 2 protein [Adhaeribacter swui]